MYLNTHTYNLHPLNLPSIHPHYKQQKQRNCPQCKRGTCSPSFVFLVWPVCFIAFPSLKSEVHPMLGEKVVSTAVSPHLDILSYIQVQTFLPFWQLCTNFGSWSWANCEGKLEWQNLWQQAKQAKLLQVKRRVAFGNCWYTAERS